MQLKANYFAQAGSRHKLLPLK